MWEYGDLKQEYEWYNEVRNLNKYFVGIILIILTEFLPERPILFVAATLNVYSVLALRLECSNVS